MRHIFIIILFICLFFVAACDKTAIPFDGPAVGLERLHLQDPVRLNWSETGARPLVTSIWYPAAAGAKMTQIGIPPKRPVFIGGYAARHAPFLDTGQKHPLIIMSHGTGGAAMQMMWLGRELAAQGYIVAAIDHHGNTAAEDAFDPRGFRMPWERATDVTTVLDMFLQDPEWSSRIDPARIGAVGFSLGGYTVTALAGGRLDFDRFAEFCKSELRDSTCDEQTEFPEAGKKFDALLLANPNLALRLNEHRNDYRDDRIKAVIALAPAIVQALSEESLSEINIPFLTVAGTRDRVAPLQTNAQRLAHYIPGAKIERLEESDHYVFLNRCNGRGLKYVPLCKASDQVPREQAHQDVIHLAIDFFNQSLRPAPN